MKMMLLNTSATILPLGVTEVSHLIAFNAPPYLPHVAILWILIHIFSTMQSTGKSHLAPRRKHLRRSQH